MRKRVVEAVEIGQFAGIAESWSFGQFLYVIGYFGPSPGQTCAKLV
ncbi:MAG: hypothetical protein QNJ44_20375 [Rhodobacter sp.]|nr:hypothetical protein [Rhodobacter sp.]